MQRRAALFANRAPVLTAQGTGAGMETVRERLRAVLDRAARPFVSALLWCHVTPNQVSLMGIALTLVTAALIVDDQLLLAGLMYVLAASLDLLDGALARMAKMASRFGAFLELDRRSHLRRRGVRGDRLPLREPRPVGRRRARGARPARLAAGQLHPRARRGPRPRVQGRHHDARRARAADRARA